MRIVFQAATGTAGRELWVTDGTAAGTSLLLDIDPGTSSSGPMLFTGVGGGRLVFTAYTGAEGRELWVTDGTAAGTSLLADIASGPNSS